MAMAADQTPLVPVTPNPVAMPRRRQPTAIAPVGTRASVWHIMPLVLLVYVCLLLPPEVNFSIGGAKFTAYRLMIAVLLIPAVVKYIGRQSLVLTPDISVLVASLWMMVAFLNLYGVSDGIVRALGIMLDALGAFLIARTSISSHDDLRKVLIMIAPGFMFVGLILAAESLSQRMIYRSAFADVFGAASAYSEGNAAGELAYRSMERMGLMRAYSSFSHPILAGVTLASLLPLYIMAGIRSWPLWLGIAAAMTSVFSVSSVTFISLMLGVGMLLVDRYKGYIRYLNWPTISAAGLFVLLLLHFASESGIVHVIVRLTLDPHNGFVRMMQWDIGMETMAQNPWFGIGYKPPPLPAWLPPSIDAHFLALALRTGYVSAILIYLAAIFPLFYLGLTIGRHPPRERNLVIGLNFSLFIWIFSSLTVAYFGETNIYFMVIVGIAASLCQIVPPKPRLLQRYGSAQARRLVSRA